MEYDFQRIESNWQKYWAANKTFKVVINSDKPKFYALDMFPYPSGAGLHVGHPLGYIASDIYSRYKRLKGFNVLHPMGYDSFGLPAEQYAIQTGQHPAITTKVNIEGGKDKNGNLIPGYRKQMDQLGFSFDWDREVRTSDPKYYKWTQWIFLQLFDSWYNKTSNKAEHISTLIVAFETNGNTKVDAACDETESFSATEWKSKSEEEQQTLLLNYRLTFLSEAVVNWCPELGTVLANDEVVGGVSERGGYPVVQKKMTQWSMRITAYAERLLQGLDTIDWTDSIKEIQRNWIGKSVGASVNFAIDGHSDSLEVFTTRPDTIFGATYMTLAPEHELVAQITTSEQKETVEAIVSEAAKKSERDRMSDVKTISGAFTGAYALHPFSGEKIPIWIGDYVLASYGTGAVMAVPAHDSRDYAFAKHYNIPIIQVVDGGNIEEESYDGKEGKLMNSDFLDGLNVKKAIKLAIYEIEKRGLGKGKTNYRLRDAVFGRQRYWGEPIPMYYKNGIPYPIDESELPLELPEVDKYLPTEDGEPPLARADKWKYKGEFDYEHSTMPGWAGSSWYFLRYMDSDNENTFVDKDLAEYWNQIDLYIGGAEHATGHLLYFRFWTKFFNDMGYINFNEPAKKLINQGMIQGNSRFVYRVKGENKFVSCGLRKEYEVARQNVDISIVDGNILDISSFKKSREEYTNTEFILENGKYLCGSEVEKMSKSKFNIVSPDDLCERYGADTLRLYEMFLGPLEQHKPWDTKGIEGTHRFLKKLWRLFTENEISDEAPTKPELKSLHKMIQKMEDDLDRFSFNTPVSNFMICCNELTDLKCNKREILESFAIVISPYAPHIVEELWKNLGHADSISHAQFPKFDASYLAEDNHSYPVSFNGKMRFKIELPTTLSKKEIEAEVMGHELAQKWLEGKQPKKVIIVPKKIVNVVI